MGRSFSQLLLFESWIAIRSDLILKLKLKPGPIIAGFMGQAETYWARFKEMYNAMYQKQTNQLKL